jgi:hypothetical protein
VTSKSTTAPVVDLAAQAPVEVAAAAMAELLIAEREDQKHALSSEQGNSNKARKHRNRRKANQDELDTCSKEHGGRVMSGSVASSSGRRDSASGRDEMAQGVAFHSKTDGDTNAHNGEEHAGLDFDNDGLIHNEPEGSIDRNVQRVEVNSIECEASTLCSRVEQPTVTQADRRQQKEREWMGKQRQRKRATTQVTLEEALARVDIAGTSLDTLNALDSAIMSAKQIL